VSPRELERSDPPGTSGSGGSMDRRGVGMPSSVSGVQETKGVPRWRTR